MGIIKSDDVIAWEDKNGRILCSKCEDQEEDKPLTRDDIDEEDYVVCDDCGERIQ